MGLLPGLLWVRPAMLFLGGLGRVYESSFGLKAPECRILGFGEQPKKAGWRTCGLMNTEGPWDPEGCPELRLELCGISP